MGDGDAAVFCCNQKISPLIDDDDTDIAEYFIQRHVDAAGRRDPVKLTVLVNPAVDAPAPVRFTPICGELAAA
jgi:hypothetical protein